MSALYNQFKAKGANIKYFPEENVIFIEPENKSISQARVIKGRIETILSVDMSTTEVDQGGKPYFSVKLSSDVPKDSVLELLRSQFKSIDAVQDVTELGQEDEEDEQLPQTQEQPPGNQQLQASLNVLSAYHFLYESMYRTGKYWDTLKRAAGRSSKNKITEDDLLRVRKRYAIKPTSDERNEVLKASDKALKYFSRKIRREKGDEEAESYREEFRSYGDLVPSDYDDEVSDSNEIAGQDFNNAGEEDQVTPEEAFKVSELFKSFGDEGEDYEEIDRE